MHFLNEKMHQIQTQFDKNSRKFIILKNFMQFLSIFQKTWWLRMSKTLNKEKIRCRGGFFEEIKAIGVEKMQKIQTETDKSTKKVKFLEILCSFCVLFEKLGSLEC